MARLGNLIAAAWIAKGCLAAGGLHAQIVETNMFSTKQNRQPNRIMQEVRQLRQTAKRLASSKEFA
jgi:methionine synthase I (cobalamin-dependent)